MTPPTNGPDGSLVSYAQNREDLYLYALVGHREPGSYVDVGCNDEHLHSVSKLFSELGWRGVSVDANPSFAEGYERRPNDHFVNAGVADQAGELRFRTYPHHDGLSTFDPATMALYDDRGYPHDDRAIPVRTLTDILDAEEIEQIDFLKIDVEGLEGAVLRGIDLDRWRPSVVMAEASRQGDCDAVLLPASYRLEFFDGLNVYYVDDGTDDITIHRYADRVLGRTVISASEAQLRLTLDEARRNGVDQTTARDLLLEVGRRVRHRLGSRVGAVGRGSPSRATS